MSPVVKKLGKVVPLSYERSSTVFQNRLDDVTELLYEFQRILDFFRDRQFGELADIQSFQKMISGIHEAISHIQEEVENIEISTAVLIRSLKSNPEQNTSDSLMKDGVIRLDSENNLKKIMTLEERVLKYIELYRNGIRISDMETPFGETRMRIGFVVKKLLDEEKIQKIENLYFPVL